MRARIAGGLCALILVGLWLAGGLGYGAAGLGAAARALGQAGSASESRPADTPRAAAYEFEYAPSTQAQPRESCAGRRWKNRGFPSRQACEDFERRHP